MWSSSVRIPNAFIPEWNGPILLIRFIRHLMTHPKFVENFGNVPVEEISVSARIFTKKATERILTAAFESCKEIWI